MVVEIPVSVSFLKHTLVSKSPGLVEGDYNTTKLVFTFEEEVEPSKILFKLGNPQKEPLFLQYLSDDGTIMLVSYDEEGNPCSLFGTVGLYPFELVWHSDNGKLTSAPGWLNVSQRHVSVEDNVVTQYFPLFDQLLQINHSVFVRYSAYPDGTDFTTTWSSGQRYIGVATGSIAPTKKSDYQWSLFIGSDGSDYVLTKADKTEIVNAILQELPRAEDLII